MHPLQLLTGGLVNLIVLALLSTDVYLFREWYRYRDSWPEEDYARRCLLFGLLLLAFLVAGRLLVRLMLGKKGQDEPNQSRSQETLLLERPEGHSLFLEFYGPKDAQPIILLHGWNSNSTQWYYLKKHLSSQYRLILMDLPGLGNSGKPQNQDYSLPKFARDLEAVVALCGDKKTYSARTQHWRNDYLGFPLFGGSPAGNVLSSRWVKNPLTQQVKVGTAVHLPLE